MRPWPSTPGLGYLLLQIVQQFQCVKTQRDGVGLKGAREGHEADERILERNGVKAPENTSESVVARHTVLEFEDCAKKSLLVLPELRHLDTGFGPAQHRAEPDEQHLAQVMPSIDIARVRYRGKYDEEIAHPGVLQSDEDTRQNPCSADAQVVFYLHAIPLGARGVSLEIRARYGL